MNILNFQPILHKISYPDSMNLMATELENCRQKSQATVLAMEYPPLFTTGRSLKNSDLKLPKSIPIYPSERGGLVTFHNPGQLVVYPILPLRIWKLGVKDFVKAMETAVLNSLLDLKIQAFTKENCPGVFTQKGKIMSMGFRITAGFSTHGMAININNQLQEFTGLNLCSSKSASLDKVGNYLDMKLEEYYSLLQDYMKESLLKTMAKNLNTQNMLHKPTKDRYNMESLTP